MSRIRIKNFGPIKEGILDNDGWIDIKKVTVFLGNQGSGKSTIAKAISTMMWIEKALIRGDIEMPQSLAAISKIFSYQNLQNYFKEDFSNGESTVIEYQGDAFNIAYKNDNSGNFLTTQSFGTSYVLPKIMYVPAERNFFSVVEDAFDVKGLPSPLFTFGEEYKIAQHELQDENIDLPINNYQYSYDKRSGISFILGDDYKLNLTEASSGLQSLVPLYLVSNSLAKHAIQMNQINSGVVTVNQMIRIHKEVNRINKKTNLSNDEKVKKIDEVYARFTNKAFINIVEEPEQNLFPSSQRHILNSLLEFSNMNKDNKLIMTTHSPYILNYLSISIQGGHLEQLIKSSSDSTSLLSELEAVIPLKSTVHSIDVAIYELDEKDGTIKKLPSFEGIPTDKNYLNQSLAEGNKLFDQLLEIEEKI